MSKKIRNNKYNTERKIKGITLSVFSREISYSNQNSESWRNILNKKKFLIGFNEITKGSYHTSRELSEQKRFNEVRPTVIWEVYPLSIYS